MINNKQAHRSGEAMPPSSSIARFIVICLAFAIAGCVSQSVDPERVKSIKRIALVPPENPVHYGLSVGDVWLAVTLGALVGPGATAGELAGSSVASGRETALDQALASQPLMLGDELGQAIEIALKQDAYDVVKPNVRRGSRTDISTDLKSSAPDADAALILTIDKNTYERRVWGKIGPHLVVTARLTEVSSDRQLFLRTYVYDFYSATIGYTILRPATKFGFDTSDEVLAEPEVVVAAFRAAIPMIAADLGREFRR